MTGSMQLDSKHINQHDMQRGPIGLSQTWIDEYLETYKRMTRETAERSKILHAGLARKLSHGIRMICESPEFISELLPIAIWM